MEVGNVVKLIVDGSNDIGIVVSISGDFVHIIGEKINMITRSKNLEIIK